jgi:hypothetical protein
MSIRNTCNLKGKAPHVKEKKEVNDLGMSFKAT